MRKIFSFFVASLLFFIFSSQAYADPGTCSWKNGLVGEVGANNCSSGYVPSMSATNMAQQQCICSPVGATGVAVPVTATLPAPSATPTPFTPPCESKTDSGTCTSFRTAIGTFSTDPFQFIKRIFGLLLGISGGVALIMIIAAGYRLTTSQGNKEGVQAAREMLTSAIVGFLFLIFSMVILQVIGVDILSIPGFSR